MENVRNAELLLIQSLLARGYLIVFRVFMLLRYYSLS